MYDNVVNQPNHTNNYNATTSTITETITELHKTIKYAIDSNNNVSIGTPTFQGRGSKTLQHRTIDFALTGNL